MPDIYKYVLTTLIYNLRINQVFIFINTIGDTHE